ncbi:MAG: ABC transporter permease [Candidatus Korobacteraceae bacterium]|jgi:NitT/TauT family transport system permease protein
MKRWEPYFWPLGAAAFVLALWQGGVMWSHTLIFPSPLNVLHGIEELAQKGLLWRSAGDSLFRVGTGFVIALVVAIPLGVVLGFYRTVAGTVNPVIQMLRPISPLAWIPLAIVWFGIGNIAAIFLIFLTAFFPMVVSTMNAVRNVPGIVLQAGRNFGLSPWALLGRVVFPAALPRILIGLRISLGVAWLVVVAAEMIAIDSGLGYLVIDSRNAGKRYDLVVAAMLLIGLIGLGLDTGIRCSNKLKSVSWGALP